MLGHNLPARRLAGPTHISLEQRDRYAKGIPMSAEAKVIVIGGGPAGSTAATLLSRRGWPVTLFERERFPRDHVGESLLPASVPILEELGVLGDIEKAGFLKKWGATMLWGTEPAPWSWYFRETNRRYPHAYQVWRPQFDQLLLQNARRGGVDVREGHTVHQVVLEGERVTGVVVSGPDGTVREERAGIVVDERAGRADRSYATAARSRSGLQEPRRLRVSSRAPNGSPSPTRRTSSSNRTSMARSGTFPCTPVR